MWDHVPEKPDPTRRCEGHWTEAVEGGVDPWTEAGEDGLDHWTEAVEGGVDPWTEAREDGLDHWTEAVGADSR